MKPISFLRITSRSELPPIADAWDRLYGEQEDRSPFLHWIWFDTFWAEMDTGGSEVTLLTAWDGDILVGVAPIMIKSVAFPGIRCDVVRGLENVHSELYQWLLSSDTTLAFQTAQLFIEKIKTLSSGFHIVTWGNMLNDHPVSRIICRALEDAGYRITLRRRRLAPVIDLSGNTDFISSLSSSFRSRLKNRWNRLEKMGKILFETVSEPVDLKARLDEAWNLEAASWKGSLKTSVAQNAHLKNFYNQLAVRLSPMNKMMLFLLRCDNTLIAFDYCLLDHGMIHLLKLSFDDTYARTSPNYLLNWKIAEWAIGKGFSHFHLGGKPDEWKLHWTNNTADFVTLFAFSPGTAGQLIYWIRFGWKDVLKRFPLAQRVKDLLDKRKWRRKRYGAEK